VRTPQSRSGAGGGTPRCHNAHVGVPWPLFDLVLHSARLELRSPTDDDLPALLEVARAGIHDPATMPFAIPWTDARGAAFDRGFLQFFWGARASWRDDAWSLPFAVFADGRPIGVQELRATQLRRDRAVDTGSWLGSRSQGMGFGTEMRAAVLAFAFEHLGAETAHSAALEGNEASRQVSLKLGYGPDGFDEVAPRGTPVRQELFILHREAFDQGRWPLVVDGFDACRAMFGLEP
jgi:RimJ/RimL family protein N-acetyltransferase